MHPAMRKHRAMRFARICVTIALAQRFHHLSLVRPIATCPYGS
jgi:hypothetical protein